MWALAKGQTGEIDLAARVARLTAGQRACLDLVDDHATSKEIALQLGISRHTVDARLRHAMQILGVASRREAAIIWRAASGAEPYQPFAYQPSRIAEAGPLTDQSGHAWATDTTDGELQPVPVDGGDDRPGLLPAAAPHHEVADAVWAPADAALALAGGAAPAGRTLPRLWGGANDLTLVQRLAGILIVAILGMLAFGLLLSGIAALTTLRA